MAKYLVDSDVEEVYAEGTVLVDQLFEEFGYIDTGITTLKFKNGALGVIDNSRKAVYEYDQRVEVFGAEGCIKVENDRPTTVEVSNS